MRAHSMLHAIDATPFRLRIAWDGAPIVSAEPLAPLTFHRDPGDAFWSVSDAMTGRLIASGWERADAIRAANHRLHRVAIARGTSIEGLLDDARILALRLPGSDEGESE